MHPSGQTEFIDRQISVQGGVLSGLSGNRVSFIKAADNGHIYALSKTTSISYIHCSTDDGLSWQDVDARTFEINSAGGGGFVFPDDTTVIAA